MAVYPVIMCGGSGMRLWPASRGGRPKPFLPLLGARSSFQETVLRVGAIQGAAAPIVVAGIRHRGEIEAQLDDLAAGAVLLLEPEGRESAAAIGAAAAWIEAHDPTGVAVIVAADHHIPDSAAFAAAVEAALGEARAGRIVTLGVAPAEPSTAYGYIRPAPGDEAPRPVAAFVEKPDAETARRYLREGYLWNSGNFIAGAKTLLAELEAHAPAVAAAARAAVRDAAADGATFALSAAFLEAPKISIDYAVMERTDRASVLPVAFAWSDIGAWDAVWAASPKDEHGNVLPQAAEAPGSEGVLVRAPPDVHVAVAGVRRLAVVVERDAVLVASLDAGQAVREIAARAPALRRAAPFATLGQAREWCERWLRTAALPVWATLGVDPATGLFHDAITGEGRAYGAFSRARVQARQVMVYAQAHAAGFAGPWLAAATRGFAAYVERFRRPDGLFALRCDRQGRIEDATPRLYEQAFSLSALAALHGAGVEPERQLARAEALLGALQGHRHAAGGFRERDDHPFQSNAHMHLLESALAWEAAGGGAVWRALADEIVALALARFIDPEGGFLREFFREDWSPAAGDDGRWVEPGHQFEWAWLLARWGTARDDPQMAAARRLYENGLRGVDRGRGVAIDVLWDDLAPRERRARLWPQTEHLKAALALGEEAEALAAAKALALYLDAPVVGTWRDKLNADGSFADEPAPASSLYHIAGAIFELSRARPAG